MWSPLTAASGRPVAGSSCGQHLRVVECRLTRLQGVAHRVREAMVEVDRIQPDVPTRVGRSAGSAWADDSRVVSMSAIAILYSAEPCSRRRWPVSHTWPASRVEVS